MVPWVPIKISAQLATKCPRYDQITYAHIWNNWLFKILLAQNLAEYLTWEIYVGYDCGELIYGSAKFGDFFEFLHMLTYDNDVISKFYGVRKYGDIFEKSPYFAPHKYPT